MSVAGLEAFGFSVEKGSLISKGKSHKKWLAKEKIRMHVGKCEYSHLLSQ